MNLSDKELAIISQALSAHRHVLGAYLDVVANDSLRSALLNQQEEMCELHAKINLEVKNRDQS